MMLYCRQCNAVTRHRREANAANNAAVSGEKCARCGRVADDHEAPRDDFGTATFTRREAGYLVFMRWGWWRAASWKRRASHSTLSQYGSSGKWARSFCDTTRTGDGGDGRIKYTHDPS